MKFYLLVLVGFWYEIYAERYVVWRYDFFFFLVDLRLLQLVTKRTGLRRQSGVYRLGSTLVNSALVRLISHSYLLISFKRLHIFIVHMLKFQLLRFLNLLNLSILTVYRWSMSSHHSFCRLIIIFDYNLGVISQIRLLRT